MIRAKLIQSNSHFCGDILFKEEGNPLVCLDDGIYEISERGLHQIYPLPMDSVPANIEYRFKKIYTALAYNKHRIYFAYNTYLEKTDAFNDSVVICLLETGEKLWEKQLTGGYIEAICATENKNLFVISKEYKVSLEDKHIRTVYLLNDDNCVIWQRQFSTPLYQVKPYKNSILYFCIEDERLKLIQMVETGDCRILAEIPQEIDCNSDLEFSLTYLDCFKDVHDILHLIDRHSQSYYIMQFKPDENGYLYPFKKFNLSDIDNAAEAILSNTTIDQTGEYIYAMENYISSANQQCCSNIPIDSIESSIVAYLRNHHMVVRLRRIHCLSKTAQILTTYPEHYSIQGPNPLVLDNGICITVWCVRGKSEVWFRYPDGRNEIRKMGEVNFAWAWHNTIILAEEKGCGYLFRMYRIAI